LMALQPVDVDRTRLPATGEPERDRLSFALERHDFITQCANEGLHVAISLTQ